MIQIKKVKEYLDEKQEAEDKIYNEWLVNGFLSGAGDECDKRTLALLYEEIRKVLLENEELIISHFQ